MTGEIPYLTMTSHGEVERAASDNGYLIFSNVPGGASHIAASTPSLKFALNSEETYEFAGRRRRLGPGQFMLVEAGAEVSVRTSNADRSLGLCLYLPSTGPAAHFDELMREGLVFGAQNQRLSRRLKTYAGMLAARPDLGGQLAGRMMADLSIELESFLADMHRRTDHLSVTKASTRIETLRRLELARGFIHAHAAVPITLDAIARHAAMSRFHLTRRFSEVYGVPPLTYHRRLRLDDAAAKLRAGVCRATDLAEDLGYGSLSAFIRAFRRHVGTSPGQWSVLDDHGAALFEE